MPAPIVIILSQDADFSGVLAEQLRLQLALENMVARDEKEIKPFVKTAALIVSNQPVIQNFGLPALIANPPVRLAQLLADIHALLQKPQEDVALTGGYVLNLRQKQLKHAASSADLTDKELQLLQSLASAGKSGASKEQLLKDVWGIEALLDTHTLETHIYRLRGKFRELADNEMILAVDGGYALAGK